MQNYTQVFKQRLHFQLNLQIKAATLRYLTPNLHYNIILIKMSKFICEIRDFFDTYIYIYICILVELSAKKIKGRYDLLL